MDWTSWFGSPGQTLASVFVVASFSTKTMVPLRVFGILTNIVLILTQRILSFGFHQSHDAKGFVLDTKSATNGIRTCKSMARRPASLR